MPDSGRPLRRKRAVAAAAEEGRRGGGRRKRCALAAMVSLGVTVAAEFGRRQRFFTSAGSTQGCALESAVALSYVAHENLCGTTSRATGRRIFASAILPKLCDGSAIGELGLTEPTGCRLDALGAIALATTARATAIHYVLNGLSSTHQGPVADGAAHYANDRQGTNGPKGISAFIVGEGVSGI